MIPKKIHYCWFGGKPLPSDVKKCIDSWKKYCPDYEIIQWNESTFDVESHPFLKSAYEAKAWAFVSDFARLKVVYENGGIYLDTDVELLKSLDSLLNNKCYVGIQQLDGFCATGLGFGAEKGSVAIQRMLAEYQDLIYEPEKAVQLACPHLNMHAIQSFGYETTQEIWKCEEVTVYPCRFFDPLAPGNTKNLLCEDTISIHHYSATWTSTGNQLKRKLHNLIGEKNILKIKEILR